MAIIFHDTFVGTAGEDLAVRTPDTVGTSWAETRTGAAIQEIDVSGRADSSAVEVSDNHVYTGKPDPTSAEYDVEATCSAVDTAGDDPYFVLGRRAVVANSFYAYRLMAAVQKLYKKVTGTPTELATLSTTYAANDVFKLEIRNAAKKCYQNGTERLSSTDNVITAAGEACFGLGSLITSTDDIETSWDTTEFKVTEVEAGVTVTPGTLAMSLATFAATVLTPRLIVPGLLALALTTFAPTVTVGTDVTPTTASLTTATFAPTVLTPRLVTPGTVALATTSFAPTIVVGVTVTPDTASLSLATFAPDVLTPRLVTPGTVALTTATFAPTVTAGVSVIPGTAALVLTTFAPEVTGGGTQDHHSSVGRAGYKHRFRDSLLNYMPEG